MDLEIVEMQPHQTEDVLKLWKSLLDLTSDVNPRYQLADKAVWHQRQFFKNHQNNENTFCFVALADERLVGFTNGYVILPSKIFAQKHIGLIENLFIEPDCRRKGIGKLLVQNCYAWFREYGLSEVYINVVPANELSFKFWESMGYRVHKMTMARSL